MDLKKKPKVVVVAGPTSSGKSDLAVIIAKQFNGEVVSADSRQVYTGMDIGTGKVTKKEMGGISHYLLDVADPKKRYSVSKFKKDADRCIKEIHSRGKLPILCGGTGFYIQAVVDGFTLPEVKPNKELRFTLEKLSTKELYSKLKKLDAKRAKEIDSNNPHRLIRAIEIANTIGNVPSIKKTGNYNVLQIGIKTDDVVLKERIHERLHKRMRRGMVAEAQRLHAQGVSWKRMEELGLEYRFLALYLQKKLSKEDMLSQLETAIWHYAKRQKTWFKKDKRIYWYSLDQTNDVISCVDKFVSS